MLDFSQPISQPLRERNVGLRVCGGSQHVVLQRVGDVIGVREEEVLCQVYQRKHLQVALLGDLRGALLGEESEACAQRCVKRTLSTVKIDSPIC